ncbi:MaoC family dehydratase N-terminal domain-containing protein [Sphingobium sp. JS3065]|uniref:FAS1-like dehydratase domain-containing protein n=1 Tax=Sphingobium sp. JS3065 TaxID=2970925 RepID=UPI0022644418|nr:MaoC family dehydratase N-terminal domain-containing protein [Sphingobium sp. JS3065]UZW57498.1 MaoC family dehydratase N-terminal domain-containing protein [Sphingobium sp. JS3065]
MKTIMEGPTHIQISSDQIDQLRLDHLSALLDRNPPEQGEALPALWHWLFCISPIRRSKLGPDGHEQLGTFIPRLPAQNRMWAGGDIQFLQPIMVGDRIIRHSRVTKVDSKQGSIGTLWFVTIRHDYHREGESILIEDQDLVYTDITLHDRQPIDPPPGDIVLTERFDDVALQRYSALTLNSHRIHFDRDYCRNVMKDERLIVHAPLLATSLAGEIENERPISRFRYRMVAPTREGETVCFGFDSDAGSAFVMGKIGDLRLRAKFEFAGHSH